MSSPASGSKVWTSVFLGLSALLGIAVLATDQNLWTYEPSHAYGLIGFVVVDVVVLGLVVVRAGKMTLRVAGVWGILQALIMLSDITTGPQALGMSQSDFARYLFGLAFYDTKHIAYLFPALFAVNVVLLIVAFLASRKAQ